MVIFDRHGQRSALTSFGSVTNTIPLDKRNLEPRGAQNSMLRKQAYASARLPLALPNQCPEDVLNRMLWHAMKGPDMPCPIWAVQPVGDD